MGVEIQSVFQRRNKTTGRWESMHDTFVVERSHTLFAALTGVKTLYGVVPCIALPRGLPNDFNVKQDGMRENTLRDGDPEGWMGKQNRSWLTSTEMLQWFKTMSLGQRTGILSRIDYLAWDKVSPADDRFWIQAEDDMVLVIDEPYLDLNALSFTHIQVVWTQDFTPHFSWFFEEVNKLHHRFGEIRFVFGFDN
jgi:hypothetical protein